MAEQKQGWCGVWCAGVGAACVEWRGRGKLLLGLRLTPSDDCHCAGIPPLRLGHGRGFFAPAHNTDQK